MSSLLWKLGALRRLQPLDSVHSKRFALTESSSTRAWSLSVTSQTTAWTSTPSPAYQVPSSVRVSFAVTAQEVSAGKVWFWIV